MDLQGVFKIILVGMASVASGSGKKTERLDSYLMTLQILSLIQFPCEWMSTLLAEAATAFMLRITFLCVAAGQAELLLIIGPLLLYQKSLFRVSEGERS